MFSLTSDLLKKFRMERYASQVIINRGKEYFRLGRVYKIELQSADEAVCKIHGDENDYEVHLKVSEKTGEMIPFCTCPYAADNYLCKHMVACILAVIKHFEAIEKSEAGKFSGSQAQMQSPLPPVQQAQLKIPRRPSYDWKTPMDSLLASGYIPRRSANQPQYYVAMVVLKPTPWSYDHALEFSLHTVRQNNWPDIQEYISLDPAQINSELDQNQNWIGDMTPVLNSLNPRGCLNLSYEAVHLIKTIEQNIKFSYSSTAYFSNIRLMSQLGIPIFYFDKEEPGRARKITVLSGSADVRLDFTQDENLYLLSASFVHPDMDQPQTKGELISSSLDWVLAGKYLFTTNYRQHLQFLSKLPIKIPAEDMDAFRDRYLARLVDQFQLSGGMVEVNDIREPLVPQLYLRDGEGNKLCAELRFRYGEVVVSAEKEPEELEVNSVPGTWKLNQITRRVDEEASFYAMLIGSENLLKRADASQPYGSFELRARAHPFDFLVRVIPKLTAQGFEIFGDESLKIGKINRSTPRLNLSVSSGLDWFDLNIMVEFGMEQIPLAEIRKAVRRGERYVKLADGSIGQIPEEWLEKFRRLWNLTEMDGSTLRMNDIQLPMLDSLLEESQLEVPAEMRQRRELLNQFDRIRAHPLPVGFTGELRPYQKHGFDWLHFLREYHFGGILADDMGLGKTVQVLTLLQSIKEEQTEGTLTTLLVVPKSLIANWQREAEKFTPGLRILEYMGNIRKKEKPQFSDYDVILTTYGTMLKDVQVLRETRFHYIILDESQAIKNPLAKSALATRVLQADHHLVMTGTPVENNTFELWSQFAFLTPGFLGSMDYFRQEFVVPIEVDQNQEAAALLRKLVYPFILRRTKEQVAPELPDRTERIHYVDMDDSQKKLYAHTRDRYRAELLGLIEKDGLDSSRMKILEGLLRLRQIAIHPRLMDPDYKGSAPKIEALLETIETLHATTHKALIFSQFVETLKLVKTELEERRIPYAYLDGHTRDRQGCVDEFQNNPAIQFFLISLKAGGVGLNLTAADYVIHLDPWWNPAVEMQASDRAHRIGQEKPVFIYKMITRDTVEEKILLLQEKKRTLVKNIISTESSFFKSLTRDDLQSLLS
jgi:non-specific serine/threonine protein kinase